MSDDRTVAAGFLLVRPVERPSWSTQSLLPDVIISASGCRCPMFPGPYCLSWCSNSEEERAQKFRDIGLAAQEIPGAIEWATAVFEVEFGWPNVFYSLTGARGAARRWFPEDPALRILGIGLPAPYVEEFVREATPEAPEPGFAAIGESGFLQVVRRGEDLPSGGWSLGYEPLNVDLGEPAHSWLCNQLERHCADVLGITPAQNGLLATLSEAARCCAEIDREEVGAEPGPWLPWRLQEYARVG
jgi:hypothetical protein